LEMTDRQTDRPKWRRPRPRGRPRLASDLSDPINPILLAPDTLIESSSAGDGAG